MTAAEARRDVAHEDAAEPAGSPAAFRSSLALIVLESPWGLDGRINAAFYRDRGRRTGRRARRTVSATPAQRHRVLVEHRHPGLGAIDLTRLHQALVAPRALARRGADHEAHHRAQ